MPTDLEPTGNAAASPQAIAVRYLTANGYEQTTASALADAVGMSRSTFFRRFGSKEDVVFADHDIALEGLQQQLAASVLTPAQTIAAGTLEVSRVLTRDPETARMRSELLRSTPLLRERELVIAHRYERVFQRYLARVQAPTTPDWGSVAAAAAVVSVHNAALRRWMRGENDDALRALGHELTDLLGRFAPWFGGEAGADAASAQPRVLVATFDAAASPAEVIEQIARQLGA